MGSESGHICSSWRLMSVQMSCYTRRFSSGARCCPQFRKTDDIISHLFCPTPGESVQTSVPLWTSLLCHPSVGRVQNVYIWLIYMARNCAHTYICTHKINSNKFSTTENEVYYVTFWVILFFVPYVMFWCLVCLNLN